MIHCTWDEKCPQELHQPTGFWRALWTNKIQLTQSYYYIMVQDRLIPGTEMAGIDLRNSHKSPCWYFWETPHIL